MDKLAKRARVTEYKERKVIGGVYAVRNTVNGKRLILSASDLQGSKNRFVFSQQTNGCVNLKLSRDWEQFGADSFAFEVLEELEKKETQTSKEFAEDIKTLEEIWLEQLNPDELY